MEGIDEVLDETPMSPLPELSLDLNAPTGRGSQVDASAWGNAWGIENNAPAPEAWSDNSYSTAAALGFNPRANAEPTTPGKAQAWADDAAALAPADQFEAFDFDDPFDGSSFADAPPSPTMGAEAAAKELDFGDLDGI